MHNYSTSIHALTNRNSGRHSKSFQTYLCCACKQPLIFCKIADFVIAFYFAEGVTNVDHTETPSLFQQQAKVRKFGPKILQLLTEWTETFPSDFRDEKMVGHLKDIIHRIAACDEVH